MGKKYLVPRFTNINLVTKTGNKKLNPRVAWKQNFNTNTERKVKPTMKLKDLLFAWEPR